MCPGADPARGILRVVRGGVLAAVCTLLALAGHVHGGAGVPPLPVLIVVGILIGVGFVVLADRRRGFAPVLVAALASQAAFHVGFSLSQPPTADGHGGPSHSVMVTVLDAGPGMIFGHVLAAAASAWLLSSGEDVLWALIYLFAVVGVPALGRIPLLPSPVPVVPATRDLSPRGDLLRARYRPRRGPPAGRLARSCLPV